MILTILFHLRLTLKDLRLPHPLLHSLNFLLILWMSMGKIGTLCGISPIAFMACAQSLENFPKSLSSSGRFDFNVQLRAPAISERGAILKHEILLATMDGFYRQ